MATSKTRLKEPMSDRTKYAALPDEEKAKFMDDDEQKAFDALPEGKRKQYGLRLKKQKADDELAELRAKEAAEREKKKADKERERGIKQIINEVRKDELEINREGGLAVNTKVLARLRELGIPDEEQTKVFDRIKQDSVKAVSARLIPAKPAYTLLHTLAAVKKWMLQEPTEGGRPDLTLSNNLRKFGFIAPLLIAPINQDAGATIEEGKPIYKILDGKRRYYVMDAEEDYPAVIVTGFPDETTQEKAEVIVNRVRNLNVLSTAQTLVGMKQKGIEDTEIRRDMGFKTGEIDKITSITTLREDFQEALKEGAITPNVALLLAKLPKPLRGEVAKGYKERKKDNPNARISEADVTAMRQKRAEEAVKRDTTTLSGLAESTPPLEPEKKTPAKTPAKVDSKSKKAIDSKSQAAPKTGKTAKKKK